MTKLFTSLRLALLATVSVTTLASCELYFGESDDTGGGGGGGGFACETNADCATGCYCQAGICEEAGFCDPNAVENQCPDGFICDDRNSCVPETCQSDNDCDTGEVCENGTCTATCTCSSDEDAQGQLGTTDAYCDETRSTCHFGTDPAGTCAGAVTCNENPPNCAEGTVPLVSDETGCYTGECRAIAQCGVAPSCPAYQHLSDCQNAQTTQSCRVIASGTNCTTPGGGICQPGDTNCTCENFEFFACADPSNGPVPEN